VPEPAADFGDAAAEFRALCTAAGLVALDHRAVLAATGEDRVEFLQGMLTNDVARLAAGDACPALLLTIQGRVTADVDVVRLDDAIWLLLDASAADDVRFALGKLIVADDVELAPRPDRTMLAVVGPAATEVLRGLAVPEPWHHAEAAIDGRPVRLLRGTPFGDDDVTVVSARADVERVREALVARGARLCGAAAADARRIALGIPRLGADMGGETLAIELPLEARISDRKGCYLGQEVVARGTSRGKVNRHLCGLAFEGPPPRAGARLVAAGKDVGVVTSVASPPVVSAAIGLGLVRREHWEVGTTLDVVGEAERATARVAAWPLA
jgi:folate-binding protein YgfZ